MTGAAVVATGALARGPDEPPAGPDAVPEDGSAGKAESAIGGRVVTAAATGAGPGASVERTPEDDSRPPAEEATVDPAPAVPRSAAPIGRSEVEPATPRARTAAATTVEARRSNGKVAPRLTRSGSHVASPRRHCQSATLSHWALTLSSRASVAGGTTRLFAPAEERAVISHVLEQMKSRPSQLGALRGFAAGSEVHDQVLPRADAGQAVTPATRQVVHLTGILGTVPSNFGPLAPPPSGHWPPLGPGRTGCTSSPMGTFGP